MSQEAWPETPEKEDERSRRSVDPEVKVISGILRLLDDLPEIGQARVVGYLVSRFIEVPKP